MDLAGWYEEERARLHCPALSAIKEETPAACDEAELVPRVRLLAVAPAGAYSSTATGPRAKTGMARLPAGGGPRERAAERLECTASVNQFTS